MRGASAPTFFAWYNGEHYHSGIGLFTPADVHHGRAGAIAEQRAPKAPALPTEVWINKPKLAAPEDRAEAPN